MKHMIGRTPVTFGEAGTCVVNSDCAVPLTAATFNVAVPLVSPAADAVMLAAPEVEGTKFAVAFPLLGVTGPAGVKAPVTPLTEKEIAFVADVTVLPSAS